MSQLESDLKRLAEPALPEGLAAGVAARIARLEDEREATGVDPARNTISEAGSGTLAWTVALVGLAVSLGAQIYRLAVGEATLELTSLRVSRGLDGFVEMLPASPAVAMLAVGMLLYLVGFFAPLRSPRR
jgi:hypothetical protein